jgi:hypothetical protein
MRDEEPTWRPLSDVTMLTEIARQGVEHARDAHELLTDAGPYCLDDATVARMQRVWTETLECSGVYADQGLRWHLQATDPIDAVAVAEYSALVEQERLLAVEILDIARRLESVTIEKLMAKSDLEIGLEALADPWRRSPGFGTQRDS